MTASGRWRRASALAVGAVLLVGLLTAAACWLQGDRLFVVRTPSMGTAAPVGTLVVTEPVAVSSVRVGDVLAFHPPQAPQETFTHRVVAVADGLISTRGDINGAPDPWRLSGHDIVGRASVTVPGVGWLLRAAPILIIGWALVWAITRTWFRLPWQGPSRMIGGALVVLIASLFLQPFTGLVELSTTTDAAQVTHVSAVSTGLLPIRITARDGVAAPLDLRDGDTGVVHLTEAPASGRYDLGTRIHLHWPGWILLYLLCAAPLIWVLTIGFRTVPVA